MTKCVQNGHRQHPSALTERGATMVEAAIALGFLLFFIIAGIDFLRISYQAVTTQYLSDEAMRIAILGPNGSLPDGTGLSVDANTRALQIRNFLIHEAAQLGVSIEPETARVCSEELRPVGALGSVLDYCSSPGNAGAGKELICIDISYQITAFLGGYQVPIRATSIGRNEPF